jgi:hypothetical protein
LLLPLFTHKFALLRKGEIVPTEIAIRRSHTLLHKNQDDEELFVKQTNVLLSSNLIFVNEEERRCIVFDCLNIFRNKGIAYTHIMTVKALHISKFRLVYRKHYLFQISEYFRYHSLRIGKATSTKAKTVIF